MIEEAILFLLPIPCGRIQQIFKVYHILQVIETIFSKISIVKNNDIFARLLSFMGNMPNGRKTEKTRVYKTYVLMI